MTAENEQDMSNAPPPAPPPAAPAGGGSNAENQWAMFIHFSLLAGFVIPYVGWVVPIVLWQMKKNEMPSIDAHGKVVANWIISSLIYSVVCFILTFVLIGILGFMALGLMTMIFAIVGGIKANDGQLWPYPCSLTLIK